MWADHSTRDRIRSYTFDMTTHGAIRSLDRTLTPAVLRLLVLVEDVGGVGAAARACGLSQPTASRALASLERKLGCLLLRRTALGSSLTPEGLALAAQARLVLNTYDQFEALVNEFSQSGVGRVKLAASRTVGEQLVPGWLAALAKQRPDLQVCFHVDNSASVIEHVRVGKVPLAFVEVPVPPAGLASEVLRYDRLVIIAPPGHPWQDHSLRLSQLESAHLVEREPGSGTRAMIDSLLPRRNAPAAQLDSNTAIIRAVAAGVGPAVLSELTIEDAVRSGEVVVVPWAHEPPRRPLCAVWQEALSSSHLVYNILSVIRAQLAASA